MYNLIKYTVMMAVIAFIAMAFLTVKAASGSFIQTDWSGGSGQTNYSDNSKYSSATNIDHTTPGEIKLSGSNSNWYAGWSYRVEIEVDHTKVEGASNLTDVPVLIDLTRSDFISKAQTDGDDFVFTSSNGTSKLSHEIESYNNADGHLYAWVKVPILNATSNTTLYLYYGNNGVSSQQDVLNTWNNNYNMVQHFEETSGQHLDSTNNNNDSTSIVVTTQGSATGKVNGADYFTGSQDIITIPDSSSLDVDDNNFSFSFWFRTDGVGVDWQPIMLKGLTFRNYAIWLAFDEIYVNWYNGDWRSFSTTSANIQPNVWYNVLYQRDGTNEYIYLNGEIAQQQAIVHGMISTSSDSLYIGGESGFRYFNGYLDEMNMTSSALSPDFIKTIFNNQSNPSTFYTAGSEVGFFNIYQTNGVLTSSIHDAGYKALWGTLSLSQAMPTNTDILIKVRTSNLADMSNAPNFSECTSITSGVDISSNVCVSDYDRYIQYQAILSTTDTLITPTLSNLSIEYTDDTTAPIITNSTSTVLSSQVNIEWITNEPSTSQVKFGLDSNLGYLTSTTDIATKVTNHQVVLKGLANCSTFYYKTVSVDEGANTSEGELMSFVTNCPEQTSNTEDQPTEVVTVSYAVSYVKAPTTTIPEVPISGTVKDEPQSINYGTLILGLVLGFLISFGVLTILKLRKGS